MDIENNNFNNESYINDLLNRKSHYGNQINQLELCINNIKSLIESINKEIYKTCDHEWLAEVCPYDKTQHYCKKCYMYKNSY